MENCCDITKPNGRGNAIECEYAKTKWDEYVALPTDCDLIQRVKVLAEASQAVIAWISRYYDTIHATKSIHHLIDLNDNPGPQKEYDRIYQEVSRIFAMVMQKANSCPRPPAANRCPKKGISEVSVWLIQIHGLLTRGLKNCNPKRKMRSHMPTPRQAQAFQFVYEQGLTLQQAAIEMHCSWQNVQKLLKEAEVKINAGKSRSVNLSKADHREYSLDQAAIEQHRNSTQP